MSDSEEFQKLRYQYEDLVQQKENLDNLIFGLEKEMLHLLNKDFKETLKRGRRSLKRGGGRR